MFLYLKQILPDGNTKLISVNSDHIERVYWEPSRSKEEGVVTHIHLASGNLIIVDEDHTLINNSLGTITLHDV